MKQAQALVPRGELALTGPSDRGDRACLPLRSDLAHIRLAGRYFVPHYVVPLRHRIALRGAALRSAAREGAPILAMIEEGAMFEVLDIAGDWAWGQVGEDGLVGYVATSLLDAL